jgi:hypothetical protein
MKRIHIVGIAFAAIFAFSVVGATGASGQLTLYDLCMEINLLTEKGLFNDNNCLTLGGTENWEWLEITAATKVDSLLVELTLSSGGITVDCEGFSDGTIGPGNEGEVTLLLNEEGLEVTEANPVACPILAGGLICTGEALASPDNLPWLTFLTGDNNLLESSAPGVGKNPGWLFLCTGNNLENLCEREDTLLTVENLTDELEIDFGFKPLEKATCTNVLVKEATVEGTVSILDEELPEGAIQAM